MNPVIEQLRKDNQHKAELKEQSRQAQANLKALQALDQRMIEIARSLVKYMDGKVTKTEVTNQLKTIGTPDALKVMKAVNDMHSTLKKHKNTDLTEVTRVMKGILKHVAQLPKENPTYEAFEAVSVTNLPDFDSHYQKLEKAISGLDIKPQVNVEAPKVEVKPTDVIVQAPDLSELNKDLRNVIKAVKEIVIPEAPKTDLSGLEKKQDQANTLLQKLFDKPGASFKTDLPFENEDGHLTRITIGTDNALPTTSPALRTELDDQSPIIYIGKAPIGSDITDPVWQIAKLDTSSGLSKTWSSSGFDQIWSDRGSLTYN